MPAQSTQPLKQPAAVAILDLVVERGLPVSMPPLAAVNQSRYILIGVKWSMQIYDQTHTWP